MNVEELAGVDLNLLVALHALLHERHVTRAARRVGMSQPAMSRALARLRDLLGDPLLVRVGGRMRPTPRAHAVFPALEDALARVRELVRPASFDPSTAAGTIKVAFPDIITYMLVPPLLRRLRAEAPRLDLHVVHWDIYAVEQLVDDQLDLTIGAPGADLPGVYTHTIVENEWACVLRRGHPALRRKWTAETFAALDHLLVDLTGRGGGNVDRELERLGLRRRVAVREPYATLSPLLVADTDLVLTTARWLALKLAGFGLVLRRPPLALAPARLSLMWHERSHHDLQYGWFRSLLLDVAAALPERELRWTR